MSRPRNATDYFARSRRSRPPINDSVAKPETEARAWVKLVKKRRVTAVEARQAIGISPSQAHTVDARWHEYRNAVLEHFNKTFPAPKIFLESVAGLAQHRGGNGDDDVIFSKRPEAVNVRMMVGISGLADPQFGFDKDWSFSPGQVVELDARRARQWQSDGRAVIMTAEEARAARLADSAKEAQAARVADSVKREAARGRLEDIIRAGRCSVCDRPSTRALNGEPFCSSCYTRELYMQSGVR